jgi:hypothetical protein
MRGLAGRELAIAMQISVSLPVKALVSKLGFSLDRQSPVEPASTAGDRRSILARQTEVGEGAWYEAICSLGSVSEPNRLVIHGRRATRRKRRAKGETS